MKKIKILPSILMLVACVAVLGVGVFAVAPTQNTISGSITINASNTPVSIELLIDGVSQGDPVDVRSGVNFDVSDLVFNTAGANVVEEIDDRSVTLRITNLSTTQKLGAYFFNPESTLPESGLADYDNVLLETSIYANGAEKTDANKIATAYFTPYYYIGINDGNTTINYQSGDGEFDCVEMRITFECFQLLNESKSYDFNFQLNIEPYEANVFDSNLIKDRPEYDDDYNLIEGSDVIGTSTVDKQLIKLDDTIATIPPFAFNNNANEEPKIVVVPSSVTKYEGCEYGQDFDSRYDPFDGLKNLKAISINSSARTFDDDTSYNAIFPAEVVALNADHRGIQEILTKNAKRVEFSNNVKGIHNYYIWQENKNNIKLELPASITQIGYYNGWEGIFNYVWKLKIKKGLDLEEAYSLDGEWYDNIECTGEPITEISANRYEQDTILYKKS